jgi:hypothetical protein
MMRPSAAPCRLALAVAIILSTGCKQEPARPAAEPRPMTAVAGPLRPEGAAELDGARRMLVLALKKVNALHPDRLVVHLSHVCSLEIEGKRHPIIDLQELVRGETTPRGVNAILVLAPDLSLVQRIEYTTERPLFCVANRLYVRGDLRIDELSVEGNELTFDNEGHVSSLQQVEANDVPAWPATSDAIR